MRDPWANARVAACRQLAGKKITPLAEATPLSFPGPANGWGSEVRT
jgi:hypothetical protein